MSFIFFRILIRVLLVVCVCHAAVEKVEVRE
jgi:hypothetical protein